VTAHRLAYDDAWQLVVDGAFVAFVPGMDNGEPVVVWMAARPDARAAQFAHDPDDQVRAAQAVGVITELRACAQQLGFTLA
jgi:hypothetical protein